MLTTLREDYFRALEEDEEQIGEQLECIRFVLGGEWFALQTRRTLEVLRMQRLARVPRVESSIVGVFNLRGEITCATDIRPILGLPTPPLSASGRLLVLRGDSFRPAILVEAVQGVENFDQSQFIGGTWSGRAGSGFVSGSFRKADREIYLLDSEQLLNSPLILA